MILCLRMPLHGDRNESLGGGILVPSLPLHCTVVVVFVTVSITHGNNGTFQHTYHFVQVIHKNMTT